MQVIGPVCVFAGVHLTELPHEDFLCRGGGGHAGSDGSWAHLLAVLTLQCAAKPYWLHGGQPAQVATCRAHVRISGLTCASKGSVRHLLDPSARRRAGG